MADVLSRKKTVSVVLTDAATVATDASKGHKFEHSGSTGRTFGAPTNGYDGQQIVIRMKNTGGSGITHTLTTGSAGAFRYGSDITILSITVAGKVDYLTAWYDSTDDRWDVVGYVKGY